MKLQELWWGLRPRHARKPVATQVIGGVTSHARTRWPEWMLAGALFGQSVQVMLGRNLHRNQFYSVLWSLVDMHTAARIGALVGGVWMVALFLNGTFLAFRRLSPWVRVVLSTMASLYWTLWAKALFIASRDYTSVGWFNNAVFAAMAAMCVFMAAREVAHADNKAAQWHRIRRRIGGQ